MRFDDILPHASDVWPPAMVSSFLFPWELQCQDACLVLLFKVGVGLLFDNADVASDAASMASRLNAIQVERRSRVCCFVDGIPFIN